MIALLLAAAPVVLAMPPDDPPRLVLFVAVDQYRADAVFRLWDRYLPARGRGGAPGGLRYLAEEGAWYPWVDHAILQAMTGPGHASMLTGAWPSVAGVPLNNWYDIEAGRRVYCVADDAHPQLGEGTRGVSPRNLRASTVGDQLRVDRPGAQVVSISLKDRSAVLMGGHAPDLALWMSRSGWTTSTWYAQALPPWVEALNAQLGPVDEARLSSSWGHSATIDAAVAALDALQLGADEVPDLLALSLSSYDKVGHQHSYGSAEQEAMGLDVDIQLARLLGEVDKRVGLRRTVVVLTGDHGAPPAPEALGELRIPAERIDQQSLVAGLEAHLSARCGPLEAGTWVAHAHDLNLWMTPAAQATCGGREPTLELAQAWLEAQPPVSTVVRPDRLPGGELGERARHQLVPGLSGDLVVQPWPWRFLEGNVVSHHSAWTYDRLVPLLLAGPGIRAGRRPEAANVVDIAPTLSWLLGLAPPPASEGRVLSEVLQPDRSRRALALCPC